MRDSPDRTFEERAGLPVPVIHKVVNYDDIEVGARFDASRSRDAKRRLGENGIAARRDVEFVSVSPVRRNIVPIALFCLLETKQNSRKRCLNRAVGCSENIFQSSELSLGKVVQTVRKQMRMLG